MARKKFTAAFKKQVAIEALKGHKTLAELASEFGLQSNQISTWKRQLLEGADDIFSKKVKRQEESFDDERDRLYQQVGKLQVELDWLKKKTGHLS